MSASPETTWLKDGYRGCHRDPQGRRSNRCRYRHPYVARHTEAVSR